MKSKFLLLLFCAITFTSRAADYYWVNGTGNWSDYANHWATTSGGSVFHTQVPTPADNVFFDANSFTAAGQSVTADQTIEQCRNMSWAGVTNNPRFIIPAFNKLRILGSLTFVSNMIVTISGDVSFEASTSGNTITSAGAVFTNLSFDGVGGEWTLLDNLTSADDYHYGFNMINGTLNTNGKTVSAFRFDISGGFMNLSSSLIRVGFAWNNISPNPATLIAGSSTIEFTGWTLSPVIYFTGSGFSSQTYHNIHFNSSSYNLVFFPNGTGSTFTGTVTLNGNTNIETDGNIFNNLTLSAGYTYTLKSTATQTINGTFSSIGNCGGVVNIKSSVNGTAAFIQKNSGTVNIAYTALRDIHTTGAAVFTATNSFDLGNNTGWTITAPAPKNLYWVGGAGNWGDGTHWALSSGGAPSGCAPTPLDNVFFDAASFAAGGETVTVNVPVATCRSMSWTGVTNNPTFIIPTTGKLRIFGSLGFVPGMNLGISGDVSFEASTSGNTITSAGAVFTNLSFDGAGGEWTLLDNLTSADDYHYGFNMLNGTLNTNGKTVSAFRFDITGGVMNLGASLMNVSLAWNNISQNSGTIIPGTSTINFTGWTLSPIIFFTGSGASVQTYNNVTFNSTNYTLSFFGNGYGSIFTGTVALNGNVTIETSDNIFNNLTLSAGNTYTLKSSATQTINGIFSSNGNCNGVVNIKSSVNGTAAFIQKNSGTVNIVYTALRDIHTTGAAVFTATNSFDLGNNTGWTITAPAPKNLYWVGGAGNWGDGTHWALSSGGAPSGCAPTPLDNVFFDAASFAAGGETVTVNVPVATCRSMSWTGVTNNPTFIIPTTGKLRIFGSLIFVPGMNIGISGDVSFEASTSGNTITSAGAVFTNLSFDGAGGEWTLMDNLTSADDYHYGFNMLNGTLNTNGKTVSAFRFDISGGFMNLSSSLIRVGFAWNNISPNSATLNAGSSTIEFTGWTLSPVIYFTGSGFSSQTYHSIHFNSSSYNLVFFPNGTGSTFTGTVTLNGNTNIETDGNVFNNLTLKPGYTYTFKSGFTQTINGTLNAIGTPGFPVRIQSSVSGTPAIFSKASGQVCLDYARIKDNTATGGASFNGGLSPTRSFDEGGNSGWVFTGSPNTYYQDADEDGYGNAAITAQTCTIPLGYVTNNTDCDDQDTNVNPGATEVCGNGIDDNCNGAIDEGCCNGSVSAGDDATLYYGYPATQCVTRTATVTNGTGPYTYQWTLDRALLSGESISGDNTPTITVCLRENANLCITVTDNAGCTYSDCATIQAKDIRCSTGNNMKVNICHNGHTLCVSVNAVAAHLAHGDYLGQCEYITSKGSIEPEIIGTDLILYPNPTAGNFTIRLSLPQDELASAYVQISTMSGRVIQQMQVNGQKNLNATVKEAGLYVVRLISKKRVIAQKITVIH